MRHQCVKGSTEVGNKNAGTNAHSGCDSVVHYSFCVEGSTDVRHSNAALQLERGCDCAVHYSINVKGSTEVLQASKEGGDEFQLDNAPVPMGLVTALKTMKRSEKVSLVLQPKCESWFLLPHCLQSTLGCGFMKHSSTSGSSSFPPDSC